MKNSILKVSVSRYNHCKDNAGTTVNLLEWLRDDSLKQRVIAIRAIEDKDQRDKMKAALPAVTVSGTFSIRKKEHLIDHSGLICIDIDQKDNQHLGNYDHIKQVLSKAPFVAYCGKSASGTGYFVIIPLQYPDKHVEHFFALEKLFKELKINVDITCKEVNRLRFYSWDDDPYMNHNAIPFTHTCNYTEPIKPIGKRRYARTSTMRNTTKKVEEYIREIKAKSVDITDKYKYWYEIGFSLATEFGESGRQYFHQISQYHSAYNSGKTDEKYTELLKSNKGRYKIATFFYQCTAHGVKP